MPADFPKDYCMPAGYQHTFTVTTLTATEMCMELIIPPTGTGIAEHVDKIKKAVKSCLTLTRKKQMSSGGKRNFNNCVILMAEYLDKLNTTSGEERLKWWAGLVWMALTFIEDAINACPQYTRIGNEAKKWDNLYKLMAELADKLCEMSPKADELGTYIYEKCAWALDGVSFKLPEREQELAA